jgi:hypothetical protein
MRVSCALRGGARPEAGEERQYQQPWGSAPGTFQMTIEKRYGRAADARHDTTPVVDGSNVRCGRANQGKARRSGSFFPDRIVCFPRGKDTPGVTPGQRNQRKAQRIDRFPEAVVAPGCCKPHRKQGVWGGRHGLSSPAAPCSFDVCRRQRRKGSLLPGGLIDGESLRTGAAYRRCRLLLAFAQPWGAP